MNIGPDRLKRLQAPQTSMRMNNMGGVRINSVGPSHQVPYFAPNNPYRRWCFIFFEFDVIQSQSTNILLFKVVLNNISYYLPKVKSYLPHNYPPYSTYHSVLIYSFKTKSTKLLKKTFFFIKMHELQITPYFVYPFKTICQINLL